MNWEKLFEIQAGLDQHIIETKGLEGQDLLDNKILALQVELGELANEWRGFKFWSNDQEPRTKVYSSDYIVLPDGREIEKVTNPLLEEYVDCMHFILSIGLELGINNFNKKHYLVKEQSVTDSFLTVYEYASDLDIDRDKLTYSTLVTRFTELGEKLGFTEEQIENAYLEKNRVNHERQDNGY